MSVVLIKNYDTVKFNVKEVLRYYKGGTEDEIIREYEKIKDVFTYSVTYLELSVTYKEGIIDFGSFSVKSDTLLKNFNGANKAVLFLSSVGGEIDRLIKKYSLVSPSKSLLYQAIGSERVESLCDTFCDEIKNKYGSICPRFSPGYGDLDLNVQKEIFKVLSPNKIGVFLNDGLIMSPSKSVTAFVGIGCGNLCNKCENCNKNDCGYKTK